MRIPSDPELLCVVRRAMECLSSVMGMSEQDCRSVTRAVDEALTNIIRHAYGNRRGMPIEVRCRRVRRQGKQAAVRRGLEVLLVDCGGGLNRAKMRERPRRELCSGGLGLHFIRESMDEVQYSRTGMCNRLRLVKYLKD